MAPGYDMLLNLKCKTMRYCKCCKHSELLNNKGCLYYCYKIGRTVSATFTCDRWTGILDLTTCHSRSYAQRSEA